MIEPAACPGTSGTPIQEYGTLSAGDLAPDESHVLVPRTIALALMRLCEGSGVAFRMRDLACDRDATADEIESAVCALADDPFWASVGVRPSRPVEVTSRIRPGRLHGIVRALPRVTLTDEDWCRVRDEEDAYAHGMPVEDVSEDALARAREGDEVTVRMTRMAEDGDELGAVRLGLASMGVGTVL